MHESESSAVAMENQATTDTPSAPKGSHRETPQWSRKSGNSIPNAAAPWIQAICFTLRMASLATATTSSAVPLGILRVDSIVNLFDILPSCRGGCSTAPPRLRSGLRTRLHARLPWTRLRTGLSGGRSSSLRPLSSSLGIPLRLHGSRDGLLLPLPLRNHILL